MDKWLKYIPILVLILACTQDHKIEIRPHAFVQASNLGKDSFLAIQVIDTRPQQAIYKSQPDLKEKPKSLQNESIYPSSSIKDAVHDKVAEGFQKMGFLITRQNSKTQKKIRVDLARLKLNYKRENLGLKLPTIFAELSVLLKVTAKRQGKYFKNKYITIKNKSQKALSGKFMKEQFINDGLSFTLKKMFEDPKLIQFLTQEKFNP